MASESSDKKTSYLECVLRIEITPGWEKSLTKILSSFEDLTYIVDPTLAFARIKGKIDPQLVLKKLKKGGKHATIEWVTYGPERDENPNQSHALETSQNYLYDFYNPYNYYLHNNSNDAYGYPYNNQHLGHNSSRRKRKNKDRDHDSIPRHERRRSDYSRNRHSPEHHHHHSQEQSSSPPVNGPSPRYQPTYRQHIHQHHDHHKGTKPRTVMEAIKKVNWEVGFIIQGLTGKLLACIKEGVICFKK